MTTFHGIRARSRVDALCYASANSKLDAMRKLLEDETEIDGNGPDGMTALAVACRLAAKRSADLLIDAGADVDTKTKNNLTPLMLACSAGKAKGSVIALRLISAGADVTFVRESDTMTALKFAAKKASPDVIDALIAAGADVDGPAGTRQTALMLAARANNVDSLKCLIANDADPTIPCGLPWANGRNALGIANLEKRKKAAAYLATVTPDGG